MTLAEQLIQQGIAEGRVVGRAEGRVEGRAEVRVEVIRLLQTMLEQRFGEVSPSYAARLGAADDTEIDALFKRLLSARSLDELFGQK